MIYLLIGIAAYLFLLSFMDRQYINLGGLYLDDDQKTKLFKAIKPFMQFLSLSLLFFGTLVYKVWGKDSTGFFLGFYPTFVFAVGLFLMPRYVSQQHSKLTLLCSSILIALSIPFLFLFLSEVL